MTDATVSQNQVVTTAPKPFAFVLMPFDAAFNDVYQIGIKESCVAAGAYCERVDEQIFEEQILERIYNQIAKADFIIADMTGKNENVFYEVGYAHAIGTPTILLTQKEEDIPFDLKHFPHIVYGSKLTKLREELTRKVRWFVENPAGSRTESTIEIEALSKDGKILADSVISKNFSPHKIIYLHFGLHNVSSRAYSSEELKVGLVVDQCVNSASAEGHLDIITPNRERLIMAPDLPSLLPGQLHPVYFPVSIATREEWSGKAILRVFTPVGTRDYPFELQLSPT